MTRKKSNTRILTHVESEIIKKQLNQKWGVTDTTYWYPLKEINRTDVIAFKASSFNVELVISTLSNLLEPQTELYEIREWKDNLNLINLKDLDPRYNGDGEGYWFDKDMNWIIYCSHEDSISFGGELIITKIKSLLYKWEEQI